MSESRRIEIQCPAKVNLALSVGPPVPPKGMHPIASLMAAVDFADSLAIAVTPDAKTTFDITFDSSTPQPAASAVVDWPLEKDLGYRAHGLLQAHVGRPLHARVTVCKRIPAGAGLGGGSSNAAGVLVGFNQLFNLDLDESTLVSLGLKLGSDVGFAVAALLGKPAAMVTGLGDHIESVRLPHVVHLTLIFPPFGCPTGEVYRKFDELLPGSAAGVDVNRVKTLLSMSPIATDALFNDLAQPACAVRPKLREIRDSISKLLATPVHVTGSGSTLFVLADNASEAATLAAKVQAQTALPAVPARTLPPNKPLAA